MGCIWTWNPRLFTPTIPLASLALRPGEAWKQDPDLCRARPVHHRVISPRPGLGLGRGGLRPELPWLLVLILQFPKAAEAPGANIFSLNDTAAD